MSIKVRIPAPLRKITKGKAEVESKGNSIKEVINNLEKDYSGIKERICDEQGNLRKFVNIYKNDEDIRFLKGLDTEVKEGEQLSIIPAIAGGTTPAKKKIKKKDRKRVYLTFPQRLVREPLVYIVGHKFNVVTNVRSASMSQNVGLVALELEGELKEIEKALKWFQKKGVLVEPIEQNIIEP